MKDLPVDHVHKATANDNLAKAIAQALYPNGDCNHHWVNDTTSEFDTALRRWRPDLVPPPRPQLRSYVWSLTQEYDPDPYFRLCHENSWTPTQEGFRDWVVEQIQEALTREANTVAANLTSIPPS
jgi:hypothetical protein